jgi:hypothetical protein
MSLLHQRIRLPLEITKPLDVDALFEQRTGNRVRIGYNRALRFEVAVVSGGSITQEVSDLSSMTLIVKPLTAAGVIDTTHLSLLEQTVATINTSLTESQWTNDSGPTPYHALFTFTDAETAVDTTGIANNELTLGIVFTGLTTQGRVTLASGLVTLVNDGAVVTGGTPLTPTRTMTDQEIMALLASKVGFTGNPNGSIIELPSADGKKVLVFARDESDGSATLQGESI